MRRDQFKSFYETAKKYGINETGWAGFAWINLSKSQMVKMCILAEEQGFKKDEDGWYTMSNGIKFRNSEEKDA